MSVLVRVRTIDEDVEDDEDLIKLFRDMKRLAMQFARELGYTANQISPALRVYDERARDKRRGQVTRPLYLGVGVLLLVARYIGLAAKRFETKYENEIKSNRRGGRGRRRRFGR